MWTNASIVVAQQIEGYASVFGIVDSQASKYYLVRRSNTMTPTLTQKGQVTIPKDFRDYLGIAPGDPIAFAINDNGEVTVMGAQSRLKPLPRPMEATPYRDRIRSVVGVAEPAGMTTDEYMAWLRG